MNDGIIYNLRKKGEIREVSIYGRDGLRNIAEIVGGTVVFDGKREYLEAGKLRYVLTQYKENSENKK